MGIFAKLFSSHPRYPLLSPKDPAARRVTRVLRPLESLAQSGSENLELVPGLRRSYVFTGKPPKRFGLAWIENGKIYNLREEVERTGGSRDRLADLGRDLRQAYENSRQVNRYRVPVAGKTIVVTPSRSLELGVERVVAKATHPQD